MGWPWVFSLFWWMAPSPALHHWGWPWLWAPPLQITALEGRPPLVSLTCMLTVQLTTIEVGPGFEPPHPAHLEVGPGLGTFFYPLPTPGFISLFSPSSPPLKLALGDGSQSSSPPLRLVLALSPPHLGSASLSFFLPSSCSSSPGRPARVNPTWFRSREITLSCLFSAGCCHGTVQSDLPYPSLMKRYGVSPVRSPSTLGGRCSPCFWAPFLYLTLDVALLHRRPPHLWDGQVYLVVEESLVSFFTPFSLLRRASGLLSDGTTLSSSPFFFPPCAAPFSQVPLGRILHALGMTFAMLTQWVPLTVSLASHLLDIFFYSGLAGLRYLLEKNFWEDTECRRAACSRPLFHAVSPSPGLVKLPRALQLTGMR